MSRLFPKFFAPLCHKPPFLLQPTSRVFSVSAAINDKSLDLPPTQPNRNEHITRLFEKKADFHRKHQGKDVFHVKYYGYKNAVDSLKHCPKKIESGQEALKIKFIGRRLASKIDEIINTGTLKSADDDRLKAIGDLLRVPGVGYNDAKALCDAGITSIEGLRKQSQLLSPEQAKGLAYLDLIEMEIPKDEAKRTEKFLQDNLRSSFDNRLSINAVHRDDVPIVHGLEFTLTHPDMGDPALKKNTTDGVRQPFLAKVIDALKNLNVVQEDLAPKDKYKFVGLLKTSENEVARMVQLHRA